MLTCDFWNGSISRSCFDRIEDYIYFFINTSLNDPKIKNEYNTPIIKKTFNVFLDNLYKLKEHSAWDAVNDRILVCSEIKTKNPELYNETVQEIKNLVTLTLKNYEEYRRKIKEHLFI